MSNNRSQISPIPPVPYGDRFLNFITGITMTKEEAGRRKTLEGARSDVDAHNVLHHHHIPHSPIGDDDQSPTSPRGSEVERTMQKAQKATDKQTSEKGRKVEEEEKPDRTLTTSRDEGRATVTLPVVQESAEGNSDVSGQSERQMSTISDMRMTSSRVEERLTFIDSGKESSGASDGVEVQDQAMDEKSEFPRLGSDLIPTLQPLSSNQQLDEPEKRLSN